MDQGSLSSRGTTTQKVKTQKSPKGHLSLTLMQVKKNRLGGLNCRLFTFFLAQASVQGFYNQFSPPNLFFLMQVKLVLLF